MKQFIAVALFLSFQVSIAQQYTRKDSLQGGQRPERSSYDVQRYNINIRIDPEQKSIRGFNEIIFKTTDQTTRIQIDLFQNMKVDSIVYTDTKLSYNRDFNAVFVSFPSELKKDTNHSLKFYYSGMPLSAKNSPWDGGFDWKKDSNGNPWVGVAVQGTGASLWLPIKDSQDDEPDLGVSIKVAVPNGLMNVSNGRFKGSTNLNDGFTQWSWELLNPINAYNITVNIGDYVHIFDNYKGLDLDYYVIRGNESLANKHFEQVKPMMDCFQRKFGAYPFASDGYKLVESPYLGMEHQSAVAYGNRFMPGYLGSDTSGTGIGLLFDFIIIHESAHEWFGNSITSKDIADMWIHEAFTTYAESVFVECEYGTDKAIEYINGLRKNIRNDIPIIGDYGVNSQGSTDMYYKGALMLNSIRHIVNNDEKWWAILLKFSESFRHKIIDTETVIRFFNAESGINLTPVFDQYLRTPNIPELVLQNEGKKLVYFWKNVVPNFQMPVVITLDGQVLRLNPTAKPQSKSINRNSNKLEVATDEFLIDVVIE